MDKVNSEIDALTNTHRYMHTRNQHYSNADTAVEAIVDRVMELEADNTFNGTNVQANNDSGGNNSNNGTGDNGNGSALLIGPTEFVQEI